MARKRKRRPFSFRGLFVGLIAIAATLLVLVPALLFVALSFSGVRSALLAWTSELLHQRTGIETAAEDFSLNLLHGKIELMGVSVASADGSGRDLLTADRARAHIDWGSLAGDGLKIREIALDRPHLDLAASWPTLKSDPRSDGSTSTSVSIERFVLSEGSVGADSLSEDLDIWLDAWAAVGIEATGRFDEAGWDAEVLSADLAATSHRRAPVKARLSGSVNGRDGSVLEITALDLQGTALALTAQGSGDLLGEGASSFAFDLNTDLAQLFPDLTPDGTLAATGDLEFRSNPTARLESTFDLQAQQIPAVLLDPLLAKAEMDVLDLDGGTLELRSQLELDLGLEASAHESDRIVGFGQLTWDRAGDVLLTADVEAFESPETTGNEIGLRLDTELLPTASGTRRIQGEFTAPAWSRLAESYINDLRLDLETENLPEAGARLGLDLGDLPWWPRGRVSGGLGASGPVTTPDLTADLSWLDGETLVLTASAQATPGAVGTNEVLIEAQAQTLYEVPGTLTVRGSGRLHSWNRPGEGTLQDGNLALEAPDLSTNLESLLDRAAYLFPNWDPEAEWIETASTFARVLAGSVQADLDASGALLDPRLRGTIGWSSDAVAVEDDLGTEPESAQLHVDGPFSAIAPCPSDAAMALHLDLTRIDLARFEPLLKEDEASSLAGSLGGQARWVGACRTWSGTLDLAGNGLRFRDLPEIEDFQVALTSDGESLSLDNLSAGILMDPEDASPLQLRATGRSRAEIPVSTATLEFDLSSLGAPDETAHLAFQLDAGTVEGTLSFSGNPGRLAMRIPLPALASSSELGTLFEIPASLVNENLIEADFSSFAAGSLWEILVPEGPPGLNAEFDGKVTFDPNDPVRATGALTLSNLEIPLYQAGLRTDRPVEVTLSQGTIDVHSFKIVAHGSGAESELGASARLVLSPDWELGDDPASLLVDSDLDLSGQLSASILTPLLGGGIAEGQVDLQASLSGPLSNPDAELQLEGPDVEIDLLSDLATRISSPVIEATYRDGELQLETASATINRGTVEIRGGSRPADTLQFEADVDGLRLRLDYGLTVVLQGELGLLVPANRFPTISGEIEVTRGLIRRDMYLDRELLSLLLEPPDPARAEVSFLDSVALEIKLSTAEGVMLENNLGRLRAAWSPLAIDGTIANPTVSGTVNVDPGGLMALFGQVVRIDEASLALTGVSGLEPQLILETTSSLEDSSIRHWDQADFSSGWGDRGTFQGGMFGSGSSLEGAADSLNAGLSSYYSDRLAGALSGGLATTQLSVKPLTIFGESNTEARLTITQQLSANVLFLTSQNPRESEGRTNMLEFYGYAWAPNMKAQVFNDDDARDGATLQQTRRLGRGSGDLDSRPRLKRIRVEAPEGLSKRAMRRASGFIKGDRVPEGSDFDVEVDVTERLRQLGFPTPRVRASLEPLSASRTQILVNVEPGPKAEYIFSGEKFRRRTRQSISAHYRPQPWAEPASLERMQDETERALRARGHLFPEVEITVDRANPTDSDNRTVSIHSVGGETVELAQPVFQGIDERIAARLQPSFASPLSRIELAAAVPQADQYLLNALLRQGYRDARIAAREMSVDRTVLTVDLEPGPRTHLDQVTFSGLSAENEERVVQAQHLEPGEPARIDRIVAAIHGIETDLRGRGHREAHVDVAATERDSSDQPGLDVRFDVVEGPKYIVDSAKFEGLGASNPKWVEKIAAVKTDIPYVQGDLSRSRSNLFQTTVFERIRTRTEIVDSSPDDSGALRETVTFDLNERRRYSMSYGGRWRQDDGVGAVVYVTNQNFLGRGQTMGVRTVVSGEEQRLGFYWAKPRVFTRKGILEGFLEWGNVTDGGGINARGIESWLQYTFPTGARTNHRLYLLYEDKTFAEDSLDDDEERVATAVSPYLGWQFFFDTRQRALGFAANSKDNVFSLDLSGASSALGSDFSVLRGFTQFKTYRPAGRTPSTLSNSKANRWIQSFRFGLLEPFDGTIPTFDRLKAGGEYSVRGYARETLGPLAEDGTPLGGEVMFIMNQEVHVPVWKELKVMGFFDAGNIWADLSTVEADLAKSVGVGLRANTPIGPLRLDLAYPLDRREGIDSEYSVYIGIGPTF